MASCLMLRDMPEFMLEIVEGPEAGRRIPLSGPLELGRDATIGAPLLQDELVSARHVRVTPLDDGARVEDLGSRNGTFVDGDQIFSPAFLAPGGQLLVGVSVLQLRPTSEASAGQTAVRPIPTSLTAFRPLPTEEPVVTAARQVPTLATDEAEPNYVPASALQSDAASGQLTRLLDVHTKGKARGAPIGLFVLVALAVILYLALR